MKIPGCSMAQSRSKPLQFFSLMVVVLVSVPPFVFPQSAPDAPNGSAQITPQPQGMIKAVSEEVLLDMVARDRHGKPVRDLMPDQVEVFEDGVQQKVTSFRFVEGEAPVLTAPHSGKPGTQQPEVALGQLNLVSMVFERLGEQGRINAREAAMAFLKTELRSNVYIAIFTNDKA